MELHGGRGGMSSARGRMTGIFSGGNRGKNNSKQLFPSRINRLNSTGDAQKLTEHFEKVHGGSGREFAITVDKNGYATSYTAGNSGSVSPNGKYTQHGELVVHNHPRSGWGNFSGEDLEYAAKNPVRGIVAVSRKVKVPDNSSRPETRRAYSNRRAGQYTFTKGTHFNSEGFRKAIKSLKVHDGNYDRELGKWLEKNQKTYGYKYSFKPTNKS